LTTGKILKPFCLLPSASCLKARNLSSSPKVSRPKSLAIAVLSRDTSKKQQDGLKSLAVFTQAFIPDPGIASPCCEIPIWKLTL
jgi:hypothetical protein